jgi:hypothetical protein
LETINPLSQRRRIVATTLAVRTAPGAVSIPVGQRKNLGQVDVSGFGHIRVVAGERVGSPTGVKIRLTLTESTELVAQLDTLSLTPQAKSRRCTPCREEISPSSQKPAPAQGEARTRWLSSSTASPRLDP